MEAKEYFDQIKELKNKTTDEGLNKFYDAALIMMDKYNRTGQKVALDKILFLLDVIPKERELIKLGINIFIYKDDINTFINKVENEDVKITNLSKFPREIPDELVDIIESSKDIFDDFYVLFTDYTGEVERQIEKERREKDPILLGAFKNGSTLHERMYYLGDWEDEYCDLTLEKLIQLEGENIAKTVSTPISKEELILEHQRLKEDKNDNIKHGKIVNNNISVTKIDEFNNNESNRAKEINKNYNFFSKVKSVFKRK